MRSTLAAAVATPRFRAVLVGVFAGLALCLALAGVYAVMAYAVGRRIPEIGVRMALGAAPRDILRLVLGQGLKLAAAGIAIGLVLALALVRALAQMLFSSRPADPLVFGVSAADPYAFGIVPVLLLLTTIAACTAPALRASRVDPMQALRE
jgi:ABC-type antimicrobial peptide transport system permease subunit